MCNIVYVICCIADPEGFANAQKSLGIGQEESSSHSLKTKEKRGSGRGGGGGAGVFILIFNIYLKVENVILKFSGNPIIKIYEFTNGFAF